MTVRAKFKCTQKVINEEGGSINLEVVTSGCPENDEFFKWTPAGSLHMGTINREALDQFEVGGEYYVDFTAAK